MSCGVYINFSIKENVIRKMFSYNFLFYTVILQFQVRYFFKICVAYLMLKVFVSAWNCSFVSYNFVNIVYTNSLVIF